MNAHDLKLYDLKCEDMLFYHSCLRLQTTYLLSYGIALKQRWQRIIKEKLSFSFLYFLCLQFSLNSISGKNPECASILSILHISKFK